MNDYLKYLPDSVIENPVFSCVLLLAAITFVMLYVGPVNKLVARIWGAEPGLSFSAYLWELELDNDRRLHWLGALLRPVVDGITHACFGQVDHCQQAFIRDSLS